MCLHINANICTKSEIMKQKWHNDMTGLIFVSGRNLTGLIRTQVKRVLSCLNILVPNVPKFPCSFESRGFFSILNGLM